MRFDTNDGSKEAKGQRGKSHSYVVDARVSSPGTGSIWLFLIRYLINTNEFKFNKFERLSLIRFSSPLDQVEQVFATRGCL